MAPLMVKVFSNRIAPKRIHKIESDMIAPSKIEAVICMPGTRQMKKARMAVNARLKGIALVAGIRRITNRTRIASMGESAARVFRGVIAIPNYQMGSRENFISYLIQTDSFFQHEKQEDL
jgi:hypothetical protein